jgi:hypothetical protein
MDFQIGRLLERLDANPSPDREKQALPLAMV